MEALATKRIHTALENFDRFADALESHLALEEFFQFRTIEALCPWLSEELEVVRGEHAGLRSQSEKVRMLLLVGDAETSATDLGRFADAIAEHEEREESLMLRAAQRRERN